MQFIITTVSTNSLSAVTSSNIGKFQLPYYCKNAFNQNHSYRGNINLLITTTLPNSYWGFYFFCKI